MSIRVQLLSLVSILALALGALSGLSWWEARARVETIQQALQVEDFSAEASGAVLDLVNQRAIARAGLLYPALRSDEISLTFARLKQSIAQQAWQAMSSAEAALTPSKTSLLREAGASLAALGPLEARVLQRLGERNAAPDPALADEWGRASAAAIADFHHMRDAIVRPLLVRDQRLAESAVIREAIFRLSEAAYEQRSVLAAAVLEPRAPSNLDAVGLAGAHGHVVANWSILTARRDLQGYLTRRAIDSAEQFFQHQFGRPEDPLRRVGGFDVSAIAVAEWRHRFSDAIEAAQGVQIALRNETRQALAAMQRSAAGRLWIAGASLVVAFAVFLLSVRVIWIGVSRDLAAQRTELEAIGKQERLSSLGALVAGVAHEINTPIGVAVTAASYLADITQQLEKDYQQEAVTRSALEEYIATAAEGSGMILSNLERAASLISSFKRISVDQTSDERRPFNLSQTIEDVVATLRPQLRLTTHRIAANCPPDLMMDGYPGLMSQILTNLITNSLVHAFPGGRAGGIDIAANIRAGSVTLMYRDDGVGAPESVLNRMFEPFFTTKRGSGGSGLGLSIVHTLVTQKLNGEIRVTATNPGLCFVITMPQAAPFDGDDPSASSDDERRLPHRSRARPLVAALSSSNRA